MATITIEDFVWIRDWVQGHREVYVTLSTWGIDKATLKAGLQTVEDYMANGFTTTPTSSIRAAIEAVTGAATAQQASTLLAVWATWKTKNFLGE